MISRHRGRGVPARAINPAIALIVGRWGVPVPGVRILRVHGRRSGRLHAVPITITSHDELRYLVAVRGETDWSRNLEAAGWGELIRGKQVERVRATRVSADEAQRGLSSHLARHGWATRRLLGVGRRPDPAELGALATRTPVFRLSTWNSDVSGR